LKAVKDMPHRFIKFNFYNNRKSRQVDKLSSIFDDNLVTLAPSSGKQKSFFRRRQERLGKLQRSTLIIIIAGMPLTGA